MDYKNTINQLQQAYNFVLKVNMVNFIIYCYNSAYVHTYMSTEICEYYVCICMLLYCVVWIIHMCSFSRSFDMCLLCACETRRIHK